MKKIFIIILSIICCFGLAACGNNANSGAEENPLDAGAYDESGNFVGLNWFPDAQMNSIDDSKWETRDGLLYYNGNEADVSRGIDVSSNQGVIDWEAVKKSGISFAIIRTGYRRYGAGIIEADPTCYWNLKQAKNAGLDVGVYFFSQAISEAEAREEAQFTISALDGMELDLPVYFDTEPISYDTARTDNLSGDELTDFAFAFFDEVEKAGYTPGVYASQMWLCNHLDYMRFEGYDKWMAKYTDELNYPYELHLWQHSDCGYVDGIEGAVDLNVRFE